MVTPIFLLFLAVWSVGAQDTYDYAANQLADYLASAKKSRQVIRTESGRPVEYDEITSTFNKNLMESPYFLDSQAHTDRARVPERVVHVKGVGAHGYFKVTHDVSKYTKANFLQIGKKTPVYARLSPAFQERGNPDTTRDINSLGLKLYTDEGIQDFVCFNIPIFIFNEPILFALNNHAQRRNPVTNLADDNSKWDIATLAGEPMNALLYRLSKFGLHDGFRFQNFFPVHTYELVNKQGELHYVRFNFTTDKELKFLTAAQARTLAVQDPDYTSRDFYNALANGTYPTWTLKMQVMTREQIHNASFDPFSLIRDWPTDLYPLKPVGQLVLNRNPTNYFKEVEQAAFCPSNLVPGILGGVDRVFQARRFAYKDAQRYRIGANFMELPINRPKMPLYNYIRDAPMQFDDQSTAPNYYPNSFGGPVPYKDTNKPKNSLVGNLIPRPQPDEDIYQHAKDFYANRLTESDQCDLATIIGLSLNKTVNFLQKRAVTVLTQINKKLGSDVQLALASELVC